MKCRTGYRTAKETFAPEIRKAYEDYTIEFYLCLREKIEAEVERRIVYNLMLSLDDLFIPLKTINYAVKIFRENMHGYSEVYTPNELRQDYDEEAFSRMADAMRDELLDRGIMGVPDDYDENRVSASPLVRAFIKLDDEGRKKALDECLKIIAGYEPKKEIVDISSELMGTKQASDALGIPQDKALGLVRSGEIYGKKVGNKWLMRASEVEKFKEKKK